MYDEFYDDFSDDDGIIVMGPHGIMVIPRPVRPTDFARAWACKGCGAVAGDGDSALYYDGAPAVNFAGL